MPAKKGQAKTQTKPSERFKEFPNNPRKITQQGLLELGESLIEYGSLDGFVVNRSAGKYKDCIVSGNQKNKHVKLAEAEIQILEKYDEPTVAGTTGVGHVIYKGERFPYREVSWSERKCEIANLRANNYGGENDRDLLLTFDSEVLELGGVDLVFEEAKLAFDKSFINYSNVLDSTAKPDENDDQAKNKGGLAKMFGLPPFSVLNARSGEWQARKREWLSLGIKSELGRGGDPGMGESLGLGAIPPNQATILSKKYKKGLLGFSEQACKGYKAANTEGWNGTSIFDPVLTEICYLWFAGKGASVLDPFAGGSVRGIVAAQMGMAYTGVELRSEQVLANRQQALEICTKNAPSWIVGDSREIDKLCGGEFDFVFSCPPYAHLEVYSNDYRDLSTMGYEDFREAYFEIIAKTCKKLKDNRFAAFVVGEVRGKGGDYYGFVSDTIAAFQQAGLKYYNEIILVTAIGSLPIRVGRQFDAGRKIGKTHQNVLVFLKGDSKKAAEYCGKIEGMTELLDLATADSAEFGDEY